jgi:hypothetical protein
MELPTFTTKAELARQNNLDTRNPILAALEDHTVGQVKLRGSDPVKVYDRERAQAALAQALAIAAKNAQK